MSNVPSRFGVVAMGMAILGSLLLLVVPSDRDPVTMDYIFVMGCMVVYMIGGCIYIGAGGKCDGQEP